VVNPDLEATARNLASLHLVKTPDELTLEIAKEMRKHYILGGISALDALVDAIPATVLDLPEEQRKLLAAIVKVVDNFTTVLKDKLA
jgi:hypothetical protein